MQVLKGLGYYLATSKPSLLLEVLSADVARGVQTLLAPLGYLFYLIDEVRPPQLQVAIVENAHHNYLCVQPQVATGLHLPLS